MAKIELVKSKKSRSQITQEWLDNCALEGIFPDQKTLDEFAMVDASEMTPEQYLAYLNQKYPSKN
jgi:hypothetical protein